MSHEQKRERTVFVRTCAFCGAETRAGERLSFGFESRRYGHLAFEVHARCVKNALTSDAGRHFDLDDIVTH